MIALETDKFSPLTVTATKLANQAVDTLETHARRGPPAQFDHLPSTTLLILFSMLDQELHLFTSTSARMSLTRDSVLQSDLGPGLTQ